MGSSGCVEILPALVDAKGDLIVATANDVVARLPVGSDTQVLTADSAQATGVKWVSASGDGDLLLIGEGSYRRDLANGIATMVTTNMRVTYFTARKSETTTQVRLITSNTAAVGATLCRMGLYTVDASNNGVLVASTANDTTLFSAANTSYTRSWSVPYAKVAGQRYALAVLVACPVTMPTLVGYVAGSGSETFMDPRLSGFTNAIIDLPASFLAAAILASTIRVYFAVLP